MKELLMQVGTIRRLVIYYSGCLALGVAGFAFSFVWASRPDSPITFLSVLGAASSSLVGCTVFYIRKLYKACINEVIVETSKSRLQSLGTALYFIFRPVFSVAFSLLVVLLLKLSVSFVDVTEANLNKNFVLLSLLLGFFAGFGSGDVLTFLETRAKKIVPEAFRLP